MHSLLQNLKKPQMWKLNMDINREGYGEKRELIKMPAETVRISHPKTPTTWKHPTIHKDNWKHPKIIDDGDERKTQVPEEEPSMEKRGKYGETQQKG